MLRIALFAAILSLALHVFSQTLSTNTSVRSCMFMHPQQGAYIETYLVVGGNLIKYIPVTGNQFQGAIEVQVMAVSGNDVLNFDKYLLNTPAISDTSDLNFSIIDQRRLSVPNKAMSVEVKITDINNPENIYQSTEAMIPFTTEAVQISDVQLIDSYITATAENNFTKNGMEMKPYPLTYYPTTQNKLICYGEVYNTEKFIGAPFLMTYTLRNSSTNEINQHFYQYSKFNAAPVVSFLREFDISNLPTGNYNIVVEVRSIKNELIVQKQVFIQRTNRSGVNAWENISMTNTQGTFVDEYSAEQLSYFLDVLRPRATSTEIALIESLIPVQDVELKKRFLYNFWLHRNSSAPYDEWLKYLELVQTANKSFGTPSRDGYKTDRGRVFLEYGPPYDVVTSVNEPGAYPYEIWFYATLPDKQSNIGFAFYEPSLVSNDYVLLHSNARGELHDPRWKIVLYENVASPQQLFDYDRTEVESDIGGHRAVDMYNF